VGLRVAGGRWGGGGGGVSEGRGGRGLFQGVPSVQEGSEGAAVMVQDSTRDCLLQSSANNDSSLYEGDGGVPVAHQLTDTMTRQKLV